MQRAHPPVASCCNWRNSNTFHTPTTVTSWQYTAAIPESLTLGGLHYKPPSFDGGSRLAKTLSFGDAFSDEPMPLPTVPKRPSRSVCLVSSKEVSVLTEQLSSVTDVLSQNELVHLKPEPMTSFKLANTQQPKTVFMLVPTCSRHMTLNMMQSTSEFAKWPCMCITACTSFPKLRFSPAQP